jgi:hypothetical protein
MLAGMGGVHFGRGDGTGRRTGPCPARGRTAPPRRPPEEAQPAPRPEPAPRRARAPLEEIQRPPAPLPAAARAAAAARAFAAGNGYLTGLLVDRTI